jgi:voltage-gated sodium channel
MVAEKKKTKKSYGPKKFVDTLYYDDDQRRLTKLVTGFTFEMFIMFVILANAVVLGLMTSPTMDFYYGNLLYLLDRVFMGVFIVEMLLKMFALKKKFFKSGWNIFDLIIVAVSSVPVASTFIVFRTFRLFRLFKYVSRLTKMDRLINVFLELLPLFFAFLGIFVISFYVFAILAVNFYGDSFSMFADLGIAMYTLVKLFVMDGWLGVVAREITAIYPQAWIFFGSVALFSFLFVVSFLVASITQTMTIVKKISSK